MSLHSLLKGLLPGPPAATPGTWGTPRMLDRGQVGRPQIAMDNQGNALAAWHHWSEAQEGVYICRYRADAKAWDVVPRRLDSALTRAHAPEIALNYQGQLAVVWHEQEGPQARVCARHMLGFEETWVPYPIPLQVAPGQVGSLHTAMDRQGNIHVVWCLGVPGDYRIYTSGYSAAQGAWDLQPTQLGEPSPALLFPQLAVNSAGHGLVVWSTEARGAEGVEVGDHLLACHYDPGARSWSDRPTLVAPGRATYLRMDMDTRGNAVVLWVEGGRAGSQTLHASHLDGSTVEWTSFPPLSTGHSILWPQVGVDEQGRAHAVWRQEAAGAVKLYTKRFAGGRWDEQRTLLVGDVGQSQAHALSVNVQGQALVFWLQHQEAQSMVCVRRFDGKAWSPRPVLVGNPGRREIQNPGAVLSPGGHVALIWRQGSNQDGAILSAMGQA